MNKTKKRYDTNFKVQVVLESLNPNTTIESVRIRYGLSKNAINIWRKQFLENAHKAFEQQTKAEPNESVEELKKIIGDLAVENAILKKISKLIS